MTRRPAIVVRFAVGAFAALQRLLPRWYRTRYGTDALELFSRLAQEAWTRKGLTGLFMTWLRSSWDLVRRAPGQHALRGSGEGIDDVLSGTRWSAHSFRQRSVGAVSAVRLTMRSLSRQPLYSAAIVATFALATGATTAIVGVVDAALFRPLPYASQSSLFRLVGTYGGLRVGASVSYPDYVDVRDGTDVFEQSAMYGQWDATVTGDGQPTIETGLQVTSAFYDVLGLAPSRGRFFVEDEDEAGNDAVVVLSWGLWQRRFGADPSILDRTIMVDGQPHRVVGIGPSTLPDGLPAIGDAGILRPFGFDGATHGVPSRGNESYQVLVRLAAGVSTERADAAIDAVMTSIEKAYPQSNTGQSMRIEPLRDDAVSDSRRAMLLFLASVVVVLLTAVVNVINLMLARSADRRRELAVRTALGAGRARVAGQLVGEALLLATLGGAVGWWIALLLTRVLVVGGEQTIPLAATVSMDGRVLAFTTVICIVAGVTTGLFTGLLATGGDLDQAAIGAGSRGSTRSPRAARVRSSLVVGQVAMSLLLMIVASLFARSLGRIVRVDPGFDTNVVVFRLDPASGVYPERQDLVRYFDTVLERVRSLPGVTGAAMTAATPLSGDNVCGTLYAEEDPDRFNGQDMCAEVRAISADYLDVMGIPLLDGRGFSGDENPQSPYVGLVSRTTAELLWPDRDPIGRRFTTGLGGTLHEVVGVVADVKQFSLDETTPPQTYIPAGQWVVRGRSIVVRSTLPRETLFPALRDAVWSVDPAVPISRMGTLDEDVQHSVRSPRFRALLIGSVAALATLLAVIGLYGVIAGSVASRRGEMAIRLSLGARPVGLARLVLSQGGRLVVGGIAIGWIMALAVTRLLAGMLFGVSATDPVAFAGAPMVIITIALLASSVPAIRAMNVDPLEAMRQD